VVTRYGRTKDLPAMTSQALYNRWRSQSFDDVLGQEHITATLRNQIRAGRVGHAYLFTGLRGTGKTSMARIMAKAVNCVGDTDSPPCNVCHICRDMTAGRSLDLMEIDAASNRGIDEIRELRERVSFVPHESRYKVYVIDEVHMLTKEASNALLKTLEEPPRHVIFILCTTEPHRLLETILSRCQRFDFHRASVPVLLGKLGQISAGEGIDASPAALEYIARRAGGSFRDAESLLEHIAAHTAERIDIDLVRHLLGAASSDLVTGMIGAMVAGDAAMGLRLINTAMDQGVDPRQFIGEVLDQLRGLLLISVGSEEALEMLGPGTIDALRRLTVLDGFTAAFLVHAIRSFSEATEGLRNAIRLQLPLELALVETITAVRPDALGRTVTAPVVSVAIPVGVVPTEAVAEPAPVALEPVLAEPDATPVRAVAEPGVAAPDVAETAAAGTAPKPARRRAGAAAPASTDPVATPPVTAEPAAEASPEAPRLSGSLSIEWARGKWSQVIQRMGTVDRSTQAILRSTYPVRVVGDTLVLGCESDFHRDRLSEPKRSAVVEQVLTSVLEMPCHIRCERENIRALIEQARGEVPADEHLFSRVDRKQQREQELLNHPAVKALEQRGGQVTHIDLVEDD
jgi:DNA polymerase-3 subunit gamma/tau